MTAGRPPRVLVDATSVPADRGGVGRYVDGLLGALAEVGPERLDLAVVTQRSDAERYSRMLTGAARALPAEAAPMLHVGLCGALTTYSAFGYEIARLATRGRRLLAGTYALASVSVGLAGMAAGSLAGEWLAARP